MVHDADIGNMGPSLQSSQSAATPPGCKNRLRFKTGVYLDANDVDINQESNQLNHRNYHIVDDMTVQRRKIVMQ